MSFTPATVYLPITLISILYLPTIIYTIVIGINFHGWNKWISQTLNNPVYFIFPILTSMSFYGKPKYVVNEEDKSEESEEDKQRMHFSIKQSNILYMLFLMGSTLCLVLDVYWQTKRGKQINAI